MGYVRRYSEMPDIDTLNAIEGIVIVDNTQPGVPTGQSQGIVGVVGEAVDMHLACACDSADKVVARPTPAEVINNLLDQIGGFDPQLGKWGSHMGNLFAELRNKTFSRLIVLPVDVLTAADGTDTYGVRLWRELPTNTPTTVAPYIQATPIVPVQGAVVSAGTEFKDSSNRFRLAQKVVFASSPPKCSGVDGVTVITSLPAATVVITSATAAFVANLVAEGDVVVVGSLGSVYGTDPQNHACANAGLLRVVSVDSATQITAQRMDGTNFTHAGGASDLWELGTALGFRVYASNVADTGGVHQLGEDGAHQVLCRPLDASLTVDTTCSPTIVPDAPSSSSCAALSGLKLRSGHTTAHGVHYDVNVHAANLANSATLRARYQAALDALLTDEEPGCLPTILYTARKTDSAGVVPLNTMLRAHVITASSRGITRNAPHSPALSLLTTAGAIGSGSNGVQASRDERVWYDWLGLKTYVPEAVGISILCPDGTYTTDGVLDTGSDGWLASICSVLKPECNPGQAASPVKEVMAYVQGLQRGAPVLQMSDYILLKQYGCCVPKYDRRVGYVTFQSGVTSDVTSGRRNINRRRMADYIQDSLAVAAMPFNKLVLTQQKKDAMLCEQDAFLGDLKSEGNPSLQRIADYVLDDKSMNTLSLARQNIYVIKHTVEMLMTGDTIVLNSTIGQGTIQVTAS